jgi:ATP/ADP translocase
MLNGEPLWFAYRLFQVFGLIGAVGLFWKSRIAVWLSTAFWVVQAVSVTTQELRFDFATAISFYVTLGSAPGTIQDGNPPTLVLGINIVAVAFLALLWMSYLAQLSKKYEANANNAV